jgi:hypothetical protein
VGARIIVSCLLDAIIEEENYCYNEEEVDNNSITKALLEAAYFTAEQVSFPKINLIDAIHSNSVYHLE